MYRLLNIFIFISIGYPWQAQPEIQNLKKADDLIQSKFNLQAKTQNNIPKDLTKWVNPFIGTGGHGHTFPGACAPFGMIQLSPDTRYDGWDGCGGYHYDDSIIYGFSHTHLSGTGVPDYADLLIVPQVGKAITTPGYASKKGYKAEFSHTNEQASPGFYSVKLSNPNIDVRLTTTDRAGFHEYVFHTLKQKKYILIDLDHRDQLLDFSLNVIDTKTISGSRISNAWASNQHFYFYLQTNTPFESSKKIITNGQHKLLLTFPKNTEKILLKVGISSVDEFGAKTNVEKEIPHWNFEVVRSLTKMKWEQKLKSIAIETNDDTIKTNFYTALYHSCIQPNLFSDADGRYRGRDQQIHQIENNIPQYTVFSLWDTYRAANPLYTLLYPKLTNSFIETFLRQYDQGGDLPVWELAACETECMIGYHSVSIIADAFKKGIKNYDLEKALEAMITTSKLDEYGKLSYRRNGYLASGDEPESVSKTLEYAYDDFCIAEMAKALGKNEIANEYYRSSLNFINIFDPKTKFMRARKQGLWFSPFDPFEVNFNYTEANAWQYSLYAPHAIDVLSSLMGGKDSLENWLDRLFTQNAQLTGREQADITGLIGQYAHGNEPSHHMAYIYNYTNAPWKTQFYVDKILREQYTNQANGLAGNEDCGQMSAWYVLSSLGLYQIAPGKTTYDLGRPIIDEATLSFENLNQLTIVCKNNSKENCYIQSVEFNGEKLKNLSITHKDLIKGGLLIFEMGKEPKREFFQANESALNNKAITNLDFINSPYFEVDKRIFDDELEVKISATPIYPKENSKIEYRYTNDTSKILNYSAPIHLYQSTELEARQVVLQKKDQDIYHALTLLYSPWVKCKFVKKDNNLKLNLFSAYANQYAASGPNTLIDGIKGSNEFRTGDWQGFYAQDISAEIEFIEPKTVKEIGISCLQDMKSWIFYPKDIQVEISTDGITFKPLKSEFKIPSFTNYIGPSHHEFYFNVDSMEPIKKIRVKILNYGKCPDWHLGKGNDTWLFIDEIILK